MRGKIVLLLAALLAAGLLAAGCGNKPSQSDTASNGSSSTTTEPAPGGNSSNSPSASASSNEPATPSNPPASNEPSQASSGGDVEKGKKIFAEKCAVCHGANGEGAVGPGFVSNAKVTTGATGDATKAVKDRLSEADHIKVVTEGRNAMPAWKGQLSEEDIRNVVAYERSFN